VPLVLAVAGLLFLLLRRQPAAPVADSMLLVGQKPYQGQEIGRYHSSHELVGQTGQQYSGAYAPRELPAGNR
jgi:hypothetical protein